MNAQDLRRSPLPMAAMIQPGKRIVFRFRRNAVREVALTVAQRPRDRAAVTEFTVYGPAPMPVRLRARLRRQACSVAPAQQQKSRHELQSSQERRSRR
jgi:hypothetical protein